MYTQYYANPRHDSYINAVPSYKGNPAWKLEIPLNEGKDISNRLILTNGNQFIIDALTQIYCVGLDGSLIWQRPKWYGSHIILRDDLIFYQSPERKDDMEAIDFENNLKISEYPLDGIIDESQLQLFQPDLAGHIAQVYYSDIVDTSVPEYILYQVHKNGIGYTWYKRYVNQICPAIPLLNYENDFILTFTEEEGQIFKIQGKKGEAEPDFVFPLSPERDKFFASSSKNGDIFVAWSFDTNISLKCYSSEAVEKYTVEFEGNFRDSELISPPILTPDGYIYLLTSSKVYCIKDKNVMWSRENPQISFATAFKDNSIILTSGSRVIHLDESGKETFVYDAKEKITAPVILNKMGGLVFCTKNAVHTLE